MATNVEAGRRVKTRSKRRFSWSSQSVGYLYIAPAVIFLLAVTLYPLINTVLTSLTAINTRSREVNFVALNNYIELASDPLFWGALRNTVLFTAASVVLHLVAGGVLALLLNEHWVSDILRNFMRGLLILPWLFSTAAAALIWGLLYHPFGPTNYILTAGHLINQPVDFLGDRSLALWSLVIVNVWKTFPFYMVMILGALQSVPPELYDAARVDGAHTFGRFRFVTLPLIRPVIVAISTIDIITTFSQFDLVKLLTSGGPSRSTETIAYYLWQKGFRDINMGYGSAISIVMVVGLSIGVLIYLRMFTAREQIYADATTSL